MAVSQNWTSSRDFRLFASFAVPAIVVPFDEKEREWMDDPINQLEFLSTTTHLKEFIIFEKDNRGVASVV